jgi:hypothetical protein
LGGVKKNFSFEFTPYTLNRMNTQTQLTKVPAHIPQVPGAKAPIGTGFD